MAPWKLPPTRAVDMAASHDEWQPTSQQMSIALCAKRLRLSLGRNCSVAFLPAPPPNPSLPSFRLTLLFFPSLAHHYQLHQNCLPRRIRSSYAYLGSPKPRREPSSLSGTPSFETSFVFEASSSPPPAALFLSCLERQSRHSGPQTSTDQ